MPLKMLHFAFLMLCVHSACGQEGLLVSVFDKEVPEGRRDLLTIERAAQEVAQRARQATVGLSLRNAMGSGVVISEDGYVLTAAHVVGRPGQEVRIQFPDGREAKGVSLGLHTPADGALVKITDEGKWPFVPMIRPDQAPELGDWCVALGHPRGFDADRSPPLRLGRVIVITEEVLRTDCTITGGDSGGPLFDMQGRVIGIHSRIAERPSENFHTPVLAFHEAWERLVAGELYPDPVPSEFLALLDVNGDGKLTRVELTTRYQREVFDRLVENFQLDTHDPLDVSVLAEAVFQWEEKSQPGITPLGEALQVAESLPARLFARGTEMRERFQGVVQQASDVTVRVMDEGIPVSLGVVLRQDGLILTKASSLKSPDVTCALPSGAQVPATLIASDHGYDLALLKAAASGLQAVRWSEAEPSVGSWLVVSETLGRVAALGVMGVPDRRIPKSRAVIGVTLVEEGTRIAGLADQGGARAAGLQEDDVIVRVAGAKVNSLGEIKTVLDDYRAGDKVQTVVERNGETIEAEVLLGAIEDVFLEGGHWEMSGALSRVRDGFPSAIQFDAVLRPSLCGGPLVDASGDVIGITLARADRVSTYAATYAHLRPVLDQLLSMERVPPEQPVAEQPVANHKGTK